MWQTIDVRAVLDAMPDAGTTITAGALGVHRQVRRAYLVATAADLAALEPHDLVLTTLDALTDGDDAADVVARSDRSDVAAIVVALAAPSELPAELVDAAERASLPIVTLASPTEPADLMSSLLEAILDAQRRRLAQLFDIHQRFDLILLAGGGAGEAAAALHEALGRPVAVVDPEDRLLVVAPADAGIDVADASMLRRDVRAGDQTYGAVVVAADPASVSDVDLEAVDRAAMAIAVRLAQASAVAEASERFAAISLEELISGHATDLVDLAERAASFGWDLSVPRAVLLASIDPPERGTIPSAALTTIAAAARATLGRDAIVWTRGSTIAALIAPRTDEPAERRRVAESLRRELDARLRSVNVSIGVGRRVPRPDLIPRSFTEASRAVDVGRWVKGRHVTEVFDQLGLERLLAATPTDTLSEFVTDAIGPLIEYDRANQTELLATLGVWLETRNVAEAARRMSVHYNTLKNRLERIEEIIGPVVTDARHSLECEVAMYIDRHYDTPRP